MAAGKEMEYREVYKELRKNGACKLCSYRFLCIAEYASLSEEYLESQGYENPVNDTKMKKNNSCVICLGLLEVEVVEEAKKRILEEVQKSDYDCTTYNLGLVIPISSKLREHSTYVFLKTRFQELYKDCPYSPRLGLKESWRYLHCPSISELINKSLNKKSEMFIQVEFTYVDDKKDYNPITPVIREQKGKQKAGVTCCMKLMSESDFAKLFPFPMTVPNENVRVNSLEIKRDSIFLAGRYNKYSRELSQTPWILPDGERKMALSVEEIISTKLIEIMKADDSKFSSSGREDVDVRTLGNGRPFAVELVNPRISKISREEIRNVEKEINKHGEKLVSVRDLQLVSKADMLHLKIGEESKTKTYCCVCVIEKKMTIEDIRNKIPAEKFTIQQKTPIRVLHRRTLSTRSKVIHKLTAHSVNVTCPKDHTVFKLNLNTEAGTYIKEFVHGDFGRTQPNMATFLGDIPVDVLALDVTNVAVEWPPSLNYDLLDAEKKTSETS